MEAENVLVVYNADSADGLEIASHYRQQHPGARSAAVDFGERAVGEEISHDVYLDVIRPQVLEALDDDIDCIVTTKGMPLRIDNPVSGYGTNRYSSLESELTRVDSIDTAELMGDQTWYLSQGNALAGNPYHRQDGEFSYEQYGMRLAARLDGFTAEDVRASVDRAMDAYVGRQGTFVLIDDDPDAPASGADRMEVLAANVLDGAGHEYVYDGTDAFVRQAPGPVLGYVGHGRHGGAPEGYLLDPENGLEIEVSDGALFHTWESFNAYSFQHGGDRYGQGLVAEWIHRGGTVGTGTVEEPGASSMNVANEDRMFQMLLEGHTWAEAAWNATLQLSYVNTVVGDPLMTWRPWDPWDDEVMGDINLDGRVGVDDLGILGSQWRKSGDLGWFDGDLDRDGVIGVGDLGLLASNWGRSGEFPLVLPEPASVALLLVSGAWLAARRARRNG